MTMLDGQLFEWQTKQPGSTSTAWWISQTHPEPPTVSQLRGPYYEWGCFVSHLPVRALRAPYSETVERSLYKTSISSQGDQLGRLNKITWNHCYILSRNFCSIRPDLYALLSSHFQWVSGNMKSIHRDDDTTAAVQNAVYTTAVGIATLSHCCGKSE